MWSSILLTILAASLLPMRCCAVYVAVGQHQTSCVDLEGAKSYSPYLLGRQTRSPGHPLVREQCTGLLAMGQAVSLVIASCVLSKLSSHHQTASSLAALQAAFIGVPLVSAMVIDKQLKPDVKGW